MMPGPQMYIFNLPVVSVLSICFLGKKIEITCV